MENTIVNNYMKLIEPLAFGIKLELLSKLSENIRESLNKETLEKSSGSNDDILDELSGTWSDVSDNLVEEIYASRTISWTLGF